jgi:UTRA domain
MLTSNDRLSYLAIDPGEDDEPSYLVNSGTVDQAAGFQLQDNVRDVPPGLLTNASVRASWAALADFGGNMPALDRWAPGIMRRRLTRQQRQRQIFDTPYGPANGISVADEAPMLAENSPVPAGSLPYIAEVTGDRPTRIHEQTAAVAASPDVAATLGVPSGLPILLTRSRYENATGQLIAYFEAAAIVDNWRVRNYAIL